MDLPKWVMYLIVMLILILVATAVIGILNPRIITDHILGLFRGISYS